MTGTEWDVVTVGRDRRGNRRGDGDSVHLIRTRIALLGDDPFIWTDPEPRPIRLLWVNTPEPGKPGYAEATADLTRWIEMRRGLRVVTYGREKRGGRILGDLIDADDASASQWLMTERGWPPYEEKR